MKTDWTHLEAYRETEGLYGTLKGERNGRFILPSGHAQRLLIIATDGEGWSPQWEHVSVSGWKLTGKSSVPLLPTWEQMCWVKGLFWQPEEAVVQYHPPEAEYVNQAPNRLHLWRPLEAEMPRPPIHYV